MARLLTIGTIGEKVDLVIRQGATLGPFSVLLRNPSTKDPVTGEVVIGSPIDMTGVSVRGKIRRKALDATALAILDVVVHIGIETASFAFGLEATATAAIGAGETLKDPMSAATWDMEMEDSLGRVTALFWGDVSIFREVTRG